MTERCHTWNVLSNERTCAKLPRAAPPRPKTTRRATEACTDTSELPKQTADVLAEARVVTCTYTKSQMRHRHEEHWPHMFYERMRTEKLKFFNCLIALKTQD